MPHLPAIKSFFPYFRCMGDVASRNRYTDHEGTTHHIPGTRGGIQGDPIEMTRFCLTTHPIWGRVMNRHLTTLGTAYADDTTSWAIFTDILALPPSRTCSSSKTTHARAIASLLTSTAITSTVAFNTRAPRQGHTSTSSRLCNCYSTMRVTQPSAKTCHIAGE
jgi:hypothetical protein